MNAQIKQITLSILCLFALVSCAQVDEEAIARKQALLLDNTWVLIDMQGVAPLPSDDGRNIYIQFDKEKQTYFGYSGCNRYSGNYQITEDSFTLGPVRTTRKSCNRNSLQERSYHSYLESIKTFSINKSQLELFISSNKSALRFVVM